MISRISDINRINDLEITIINAVFISRLFVLNTYYIIIF